MKDELLTGEAESIRLSRMDLMAFIGAFLVGACLYVTLHFVFRLHQMIVTVAIVGVMFAYAMVVALVPRLRVRLDQAGDNAYYLGLLFTLVSMAFALYEFGAATVGAAGVAPAQSGAQQIIANFGIALASTITGIFLRVILHQMRIDPAEIERMTRIELAEASKRVRASMDNIIGDLGGFHEEVRQRTSNVVASLMDSTRESSGAMLESVGAVHKSVLERTEGLTRLLGQTATEAMGASERLRAVEPPPLALSRRLDKVTKVLEAAGDQTERIVAHLQGTANTTTQTIEEITKAAKTLGQLAEQMAGTHTQATTQIAASVESVGTALDGVGQRLERDLQLWVQLEEQVRRTGTESIRAQDASVEVLKRLTEITRGITAVLGQAERQDGDGGT